MNENQSQLQQDLAHKSNAEVLNDILQLGRNNSQKSVVFDENKLEVGTALESIKDPLVEKQALEEYELEQMQQRIISDNVEKGIFNEDGKRFVSPQLWSSKRP